MGTMQLLSRILMIFIIMVVHVDLSHEFNFFLSDRVRLTSIQSLTFYSGRMTTARRNYPVPQVKCVGGNADCRGVVNTVTCYNRGIYNGNDVLWKCKAHISRGYRFGRTDVTCEGYDYPNDPYILRGSCGVEYTLYLRPEPQMDFGSSVSFLFVLFIVVAVCIAIAIICCSSIEQSDQYYNNPRRTHRYQYQPYNTADEVIIVDAPRTTYRAEPLFDHQPAATYAGTTRRQHIRTRSNDSNSGSVTGFGGTIRR